MSEDSAVHLSGLRAGSLIAGYRLESQLGTGGMAVVFRARDERLGRLVALKLLSPAIAGDAAFRQRFIAESRAAAAVDDPHIIPVYEAGEANGVLFIAMRFVGGGDLRGVLEREGPMSPDRAAAFISPVASALDAAHRAGLVHRDVKPANVLVDARPDRPDHVYLSDFGVSKGAMPSGHLTGTGQFLGTPDYSAPEQIQGRGVDGRTDQYALACVAYQLLTGAAPFSRDQGIAVLFAHLTEPPPPLASRRPGLPAAADQVLARGLAKTPEKRFGSCREFADALRYSLGLPPYMPTGSVSGPQPGLAGPYGSGSGTSPPPVDAARELTRDTGHGGSQTASYFPGAGPPPGGGPGRGRRNRLLVGAGALAAAVAAAVAVILATASPSHSHAGALSPTHSSSPQATRASSQAPTQSATPSLSSSAVASVRHLSAQQMRAGDCLTGSNLGLNNSNPWPSSVEAVPCSQKHIAEVYYSANFWASTKTYPGTTAISNQAIAQCQKVFTGYVGIPQSSSQYSDVDLYPESADWSSGDRSLQCVAYWPTTPDPGGAPLYGSIRGSDK